MGCWCLAVAAASAYAEATVPEWLVSGAKIAAGGSEAVTTEGELLLEDMGEPGGAVDFLCSGFLDGLVRSSGLGTVEKMLSLNGETETEIECSFILPGACEPSMAPLVTAIKLPWKLELILDEPGVGNLVVELLLEEGGAGSPGYTVDCLVAGILVEDTCTNQVSADLVNNVSAGDVEATFSHTDELVTLPCECTLGGAKKGLVGSTDSAGVVVPSLITLNSGLTLSISEDGL